MSTLFTTSPDGIHIAYDRGGAGPALILLHGGGGSRQEWHTAGYVERLRSSFTVITLDLRGHGESDRPTAPADYAIDKMVGDILTVAAACSFQRFNVWGMSFGGNIARYLAVQSGCVERLALLGVKMGTGVSGELRQQVFDFRERWTPVVQAQNDGTLDIASLPQEDQELLRSLDVPVVLAWSWAMLDWPAVVPADIPCPALWVVGTKDEAALASLREYEAALTSSKVQAHILAGLNHEQVFDEIDQVYDTLLAFTQA